MVQYFKIKTDKEEYKGYRYFKVDHENHSVVQVLADPGLEKKKGKPNMIGVYGISHTTFMTNYYQFYVEPCSRKLFEQKYFETIKKLIE